MKIKINALLMDLIPLVNFQVKIQMSQDQLQ